MSRKRTRSEVGNLDDEGEPFFQSPLFKEIKTSEANDRMKIDLKAEGSDSSENDDEEVKVKDEREASAHMKRLRERFYEFHRKYVAQVNPKGFFNELKKDLLLKLDQILDAESLSDYYEKILQKTTFTGKPGRRAWNEDENIVLVSIATYICKYEEKDFSSITDANWDYIATFFPGRKTEQLKLQWLSFLKTKLTQAPWTPYEDDMLKQIMKEKGRGNHWKEIAVELNARCNSHVYRHGKQCRERWINHLDPAINRGPWTDEEDLRMLKCFLSVGGKKWADISKMMKDRTENSVKNRWNSLYKKFMHELGYESQSVNSLDSESDNLAERERRVSQRIIDVIVKNMASNSNNGGLLDKRQESNDTSMSFERRFPEMSSFTDLPTFEKRRRAYSSDNGTAGGGILNKVSLLKELINEDSTGGNQFRTMLDEHSTLRQNLGGIQTGKNLKSGGLSYSGAQKNSAGAMNQQSNSPLFSQSFPNFNFESLGLPKMDDKIGPNVINKSGMKIGEDFLKPAPLFSSKNSGFSTRQLGYSLGVIPENSMEEMNDRMAPLNIQDTIDLNLKEKSFKEFHENANKVIGQNNLQFAVVDLTKGELYFVNSLSHKNLQKSLSAMQTNENEMHNWPMSPLFNIPPSQAGSNALHTGNVNRLHQDFANMKISSGKKPMNQKETRADLHKETAKSFFDLGVPNRLSGGSNDSMDPLNQFTGSHLFPGF